MAEIEEWVLQFARENPGWGYDPIVGDLANVGHQVSDQTVGNILKRHGLGPAPDRKRNPTWAAFIRRHKDVLWATRLLHDRSLDHHRPDHVLRPVLPAIARGVAKTSRPQPNRPGRAHARFLHHDRDTEFSPAFVAVFRAAGVEPLKLPPQSPNLNAFAQRWVRSVKDACLDQFILFGRRSLRYALQEFLAHHQHERNHQGLANVVPFPDAPPVARPESFTKPGGWADCSTTIIAPPELLPSSQPLHFVA